MSFVSLNTHKPMTRELAQKRAQAMEAKNNLMSTVGQFQKLDGVEGVDRMPEDTSEVLVTRGSAAELPKTTMQKVGEKLTVREEGEEAPLVTASGFSKSDEDGLVKADVSVQTDGEIQDFMYKRMEDGTEVYQAPIDGGYAVVRENNAQGTLFIDVNEQVDFRAFEAAKQEGTFADLSPANDTPRPTTFKEALKVAADAHNTTDKGTYMDGVRQRTEMLKDIGSTLLGGFFGKS